MTQDNENKDVNKSLQLSPDMIKYLEDKKKEDEAKALAEAQKQEIESKRKAALDNLESQGVLKTLEGGGIREMLKNKPELLDNPVALETALENAKLKLESTFKNSQGTQTSDNHESEAERQAGGEGDRHIPEYGTPEFMTKFSKGEISDEDIQNMDTTPENKIFLLQNRPRQDNISKQAFFK